MCAPRLIYLSAREITVFSSITSMKRSACRRNSLATIGGRVEKVETTVIHLAAECMCGTVDHIALKANGPA
jgi:hypothetical protein